MSDVKSKVVKLATNQPSNLGQLKYGQKGLIYYSKPIGKNNGDGNGTYPVHLYFTSDEAIKEGDWFYHICGKIDQLGDFDGNFNNIKKIISSTDKSLGLPEPSADFLQVYVDSYNKGQKIEEVLIEQEYITTNEDFSKTPVQIDGFLQLKVKPDNTITIRKAKDSWSREEITHLLLKFAGDMYKADKIFGPQHIRIWVEQNL